MAVPDSAWRYCAVGARSVTARTARTGAVPMHAVSGYGLSASAGNSLRTQVESSFAYASSLTGNSPRTTDHGR